MIRKTSSDTSTPSTAIRASHALIDEASLDEFPRFVQLNDAVVLIEGTKISAVATGNEARRLQQRSDKLIDLGQSFLMPGLIDLEGLVDIDHLLLDSWWGAEHSARLEWSTEYAKSPREVLTAGERRVLRTYGIVQLLLHGITSAMPIASEVHSAWAETYEDLMTTAEVARKLGLRVFLGPSYRSGVHVTRPNGTQFVHWEKERGIHGLNEAIRFLDTLRTLDDPLLTGILAPCRVETVTDDVLRRTSEVSAKYGALVRVHATQGLEAEAGVLARDGRGTAIDVLRRAELINDRLLLAHGVYLDTHPDVEGQNTGNLAELAKARATIIHCPLTSFRYAFFVDRLSQYFDSGVGIALGTDSFPPDLVRSIDVGVQMSKLQHGDLGRNLLKEYVQAATIGGAQALNRFDLGRITPGATADLTAFSLADTRMGVVDDPIRTLVLAGTARDAHFSMVHGRITMRDGCIKGVDMESLRRNGQIVFDKLRSGYVERDPYIHLFKKGRVGDLFPTVFPSR